MFHTKRKITKISQVQQFKVILVRDFVILLPDELKQSNTRIRTLLNYTSDMYSEQWTHWRQDSCRNKNTPSSFRSVSPIVSKPSHSYSATHIGLINFNIEQCMRKGHPKIISCLPSPTCPIVAYHSIASTLYVYTIVEALSGSGAFCKPCSYYI